MNPPEDQLTSQDLLLLRSLLGRFGGQVPQAAPSAGSAPAPSHSSSAAQLPPASFPSSQSLLPLPVAVPTPNNGIQRYPSATPLPTQPARTDSESLSQSLPVPTLHNGHGMVLPVPQHSAPHPGVSLRPPSVTPAAPTTISPYHSALPGAQGHPPRSTRITNTIENIGSGITSLVNQQRLAAAAVNLPSQVTLPQRTTRRRRRGQAISPPTLPPVFSINSVISNEGLSPLLRIKVKVYPPQVITFIPSHFNMNLLTWMTGSTNRTHNVL